MPTNFYISTGTMIRFLLVIFGFFLIWYLRDILMVILTAILLATFVDSMIPTMRKIGMNRAMSVVTLYILSTLIFVFLFYLFAPLFITELYNFSVFLSSYFPDLPIVNYFSSDAFGGAKDILASLSHKLSFTNLLTTSNAFITNLSGSIFQVLSVAFGSIFNAILIVLLSFYFSIQEKGIENFLKIIIPLEYENYTIDLWNRGKRKIAFWMRGQMLLGLIIAVLTYLILSLLGIEYALFLAIIAGVTELMPYGLIISLIPAVSFSYLSGGTGSALMVFGAYMILDQFEKFLLSPLVIEKVVGISPLVVILAAVIGFELGGFWGLVLGIPVTILIIEFMDDVEKKKNFSRIKNEQK